MFKFRDTVVNSKRNRDFGEQDSPMERERMMSEHMGIHDFLEKKADHALKGELRSSDIVI